MNLAAKLAAASALVLACSGCCRCVMDLPEPGPSPEETEPSPTVEVVDLGVALYPAGAVPPRTTTHTWIARLLQPSGYRTGYGIAARERDGIEAAHRAYAKSVDYHDLGKGRFRWVPPPGCLGDMHCVFEAMSRDNDASLEPVAARFKQRASAAKLDALALASLVVSFVQAIRYEIPEKEPFGVLPPALVLDQKRGDCDSKALLAYLLLARLGIDSILVTSEAHRHTMLGVALPASGTTFEVAGRKYAFTEMTAKGSPIGYMDPKLRSPSDWRAIPIKKAPSKNRGP